MSSKLLLGQYERLANLGDGSNGDVYKVRHHEQGYVRAVKILKGYIEDKASPKYKSFIEEYKTLTLLGNCSHPNIVSVHKADMLENVAFYEMDYIDGRPLADYIAREGALPLQEVLKCCRDLLSAMAYCHVGVAYYVYDREADNIPTDPNDGRKVILDEETRARLIRKYGIVHNDIHSSNIMRNNYDGRYILLDFGISLRGGTAIRQSGLGEGALAYSAPEKILNKEVSFQSDVYSIGVVMYEALTGTVPFPSKDEKGKDYSSKYMYDCHASNPVPSILELRGKKDYPDWLERIILKCLAKTPGERYANAREIYNDFLGEMSLYSQAGTGHIDADAIMVNELSGRVEKQEKQLQEKEAEIRDWKRKVERLKSLRKSKVARIFSPVNIVIFLLVAVAATVFFYPEMILC